MPPKTFTPMDRQDRNQPSRTPSTGFSLEKSRGTPKVESNMPGPTATSTFPEPSTNSRHGSTINHDVDEEVHNDTRHPPSEPTTPHLTRSRLRGIVESGQTSLTSNQILGMNGSGPRAAEYDLFGIGGFVNGPQPTSQPEQGTTTQNETPTGTPPESDPCSAELQRLEENRDQSVEENGEENRRHLAERRRRHPNSRPRRHDRPVSTWMSMKRIAHHPRDG
ncbi:hypothetical protein B0J13DRAFT_280811 [Dactylonectria estremocensis]|uniref:Uncharacterized protein n=1 Tax=Dactylonectria estremocensis TaxID=1079267 RepID=A0A9P9F1F9_9HYPO|nr:hypothetical protein B0J13DRAFT_280811 [Dactylonectria estremocensis]